MKRKIAITILSLFVLLASMFVGYTLVYDWRIVVGWLIFGGVLYGIMWAAFTVGYTGGNKSNE